MVIRDLRIYSEVNDYNIFHYQDYSGNEFDAVIEFDDGEYAAFEIKLGALQIDEAAENLKRIKNELIKNKIKPPKALCVTCGMLNSCYTREDGVLVVPITALKD